MPGVCPAWKATGNSMLVEQGWPVQSYLLWLLSHFHLPLHSCCFLFQRSEVCVPMWTPHWCSRSRAVPGTSPITGCIRMPPWYPLICHSPYQGCTAPSIPRTTFSGGLPGGSQEYAGEKTLLSKGHKVGVARGQHGPPARDTGQQGNAHNPSASQLSKSIASSPTPRLPAPLTRACSTTLTDHCPGLTAGLLFLAPEPPGPT